MKLTVILEAQWKHVPRPMYSTSAPAHTLDIGDYLAYVRQTPKGWTSTIKQRPKMYTIPAPETFRFIDQAKEYAERVILDHHENRRP